jgi:hypothetical protein
MMALAAAHPMPAWVTYREASLGVQGRRIDMFAMRCRQSGRGYRRVAYEVKVSRADFLQELRLPHKRAHALDLSHEFYFACPAGMIRPGETPSECGLVWVHERRAHPEVVRRAPLREARPFSDREVAYLARFQWYREGIEADRIELARLRRLVKQQEAALTLSRNGARVPRIHEQPGLLTE